MQLHIPTIWHGRILEEGTAPHASLTFAILGAAEKKPLQNAAIFPFLAIMKIACKTQCSVSPSARGCCCLLTVVGELHGASDGWGWYAQRV